MRTTRNPPPVQTLTILEKGGILGRLPSPDWWVVGEGRVFLGGPVRTLACQVWVEERMRRLVHTLAMTLAAVLLLSSASAFAEGPSAKEKAQARELYAMGQQQFRQANFGGAQRSFEDAYRAVPNPIVLLSIAECQVRSESFTDALVTLGRYLEERPDAPDRAQVEGQIAMIRAKPGRVVVESSPAGATVWVDGQSTNQTTPMELELAAGDHVIAVESEGYNHVEQKVTILNGSQQRLSLTALPVAVPDPEPQAELPSVDLRASTTTRGNLPIWIATGVAGAGLVTGALLGGFSLKMKNEFDGQPTEARADKGERLALFADVGFGIAAAAGITAIVLFVTRDKDTDKKAQAWSLKPNIAKSNLGFTGRLQF